MQRGRRAPTACCCIALVLSLPTRLSARSGGDRRPGGSGGDGRGGGLGVVAAMQMQMQKNKASWWWQRARVCPCAGYVYLLPTLGRHLLSPQRPASSDIIIILGSPPSSHSLPLPLYTTSSASLRPRQPHPRPRIRIRIPPPRSLPAHGLSRRSVCAASPPTQSLTANPRNNPKTSAKTSHHHHASPNTTSPPTRALVSPICCAVPCRAPWMVVARGRCV